MKAIQMDIRLRNGVKVVMTYDMKTVDPARAGGEFRKTVLMRAKKEQTAPLWDSLKVETVELADA